MGRPRSSNIWIIRGSIAYTDLKHGRCYISTTSLSLVQNFKWFTKLSKLTNKYYVYAHLTGSKKILIHRHILGLTDCNLSVDHQNGDTLNNAKSNIRIVTKAENNYNAKKRKNSTSIYKGVTVRPSGRFGSYISKNGKTYCLGTYDTETEAALVYNNKAIDFFGKYAKLNNITKPKRGKNVATVNL